MADGHARSAWTRRNRNATGLSTLVVAVLAVASWWWSTSGLGNTQGLAWLGTFSICVGGLAATISLAEFLGQVAGRSAQPASRCAGYAVTVERNRSTRGALSVAGALLISASAFSALLLWRDGFVGPSSTWYGFGAAVYFIYPMVLSVVVLGGALSVRTATSLWRQRDHLRSMAGDIVGWQDGCPPKRTYHDFEVTQLQKSFDTMMNGVCRCALSAASYTSLALQRRPENRVCLILLANPETRRFRLAANAGGSLEYLKHLNNPETAPPYFDLDRFVELYNKTCEEAKNAADRSPEAAFERIQGFRSQLRNCCSAAGVVFENYGRLGFDDTYDRCITTSFAYLDGIRDRREKERNKFQQAVGVPLKMFGRKVGVMMMLSTERSWLYPYDDLHLALGDLVSGALQAGYMRGTLRVPSDWLDTLPEAEKNPISREVTLKRVDHLFSTPIPGEALR